MQGHLPQQRRDPLLALARQQLPNRRRQIAHRGIRANAPGHGALQHRFSAIRPPPSIYQRHPEWDIEQWIKEGKGAINWTRLSCRSFAANAVRLQLHALAYNLGNFLRTLATPEPIRNWSLTTLKEKLIKIGAKVVSHGSFVAFQMADVAIPRDLIAEILGMIAELAAAVGVHGIVPSRELSGTAPSCQKPPIGTYFRAARAHLANPGLEGCP